MNAVEIEAAVSELARQPFDGTEFPFAFLAAFGNKQKTIKRLRKGESNASGLPGGVLQRANIHIAVCEAGRVAETLKALRQSPRTVGAKAKFVLATDGETQPLLNSWKTFFIESSRQRNSISPFRIASDIRYARGSGSWFRCM